MLLHRLHGIDHIKCGIDVVVALLERALVLGIPKRHNADIQNPRMHIGPSERFLQFEAIVITWSEHNLSIELDARIEQPLEHLNAMRRMLSDHFTAHLGRDAVQRKAQRRDMALDDFLKIVFSQIRERDKIALQKAQAPIVIAQHERSARVFGELAHEAEHAGIAARFDFIEYGAVEFDAPIFALIAEEVDLARLAVGVDIRNGDFLAIGIPPPIEHIAQGVSVDGKNTTARREARVVERRAFGNADDFAAAFGSARIFVHIAALCHAHSFPQYESGRPHAARKMTHSRVSTSRNRPPGSRPCPLHHCCTPY